MDGIFSFFDNIDSWLNDGQFSFWQEWLGLWIKYAVYGFLDTMSWLIPLVWSVSQEILEELSISDRVNSAYGQLDSQVQSWLYFFKVPEFINNIMTAYASRFVLKFIPGV